MQYFLVSNVWDIKLFIEILIFTWIFFYQLRPILDWIKMRFAQKYKNWRNILSYCRCMKIRNLLQKLFQTICCLELTSDLNSDCLVRRILINQWYIDLLESEFGREAKPFSKKYIGLLRNTRPLMDFQTFRQPCYINSLISDDIKHQFIENY